LWLIVSRSTHILEYELDLTVLGKGILYTTTKSYILIVVQRFC